MSTLLKAGDTVAIVSPSITTYCKGSINIDAAIKYLENLGLKVLLTPSALQGLSLTPTSDFDKSRDIMAMYQNPKVKALFAIHGGVNSIRLLEHLDYDVIKKNPKPLFGFSDTSLIQMAIYSKTNNPYISGFLPEYDFRNGSIDSLIAQDLAAVFKGQKFKAQGGETVHGGIASGKLIGGNLSGLSNLNGTPYYPNIKGSILLLEDVDEKPYKISIMLTQLRYNPNFKDIKAIVLGLFNNCEASDKTHGDVNDVIDEFTNHVKIPMIKNFQYGHVPSRHVVTLGVDYRLDADKCILEQL